MSAPRAVKPPAMSEAELQRVVVELAEIRGWTVNHVRRTIGGRHGKGWVTGTTLKGWPDLVLIRPPRIVFVELKSDKGRLEPEQDHVLGLLRLCHLEVHVFRPSDWDDIVRTFR